MSATARGAIGAASASTGRTSFAIAETAGSPQTGDVRYLFINTSSAGGITATLPSGWTTLLPTTVVGSGNLLVASKAWVAGVGTETVTLSGTGVYAYEIAAVTGMDQALTPQVVTSGGASATTLTSANVTPATSDGLLLIYFAQSPTTTSSATKFGGTTPATIPGLTVLHSVAGGSSTGYAVALASIATTAAATGTFTATSDHSGTWRTAAVVIPSATTGSTVKPGQFFPFLGLGGGVSR